MIASYLPTAAIRNIRLSCKAGNDEVSPFLLQSIYLSAQQQDLGNLTKISEHPVFSKTVKKIVFDGTTYVLPMLTRRKYLSLFRPKNHRGDNLQFSNAAILRGYPVYRDRWLAHITALARFGFLRVNPLLDPVYFFSKSWVFGVDFLPKPKNLNLMPIFRMGLEEALKRMPRVTQFAVSDQRWLNHRQHYRHVTGRERTIYEVLSFSVHSKGINGQDQVVLDPGPWPCWKIHEEANIYEQDDVFEQGKFMNQLKFTESNLIWIRGLFQLLKAAVMSNMQKLNHLEIEVQSKWAGLSDSRLGPQDSKLLYTAFANLKTVQLRVHHHRYGQDASGLTSSVAIALTSAKQLEHLEVDFVADSVWRNTDVSKLGNQREKIWPKLHTVKLSSMLLVQDQFQDFLRLHAQSIKHISLTTINFCRVGPNLHHKLVFEPKERANIRPYEELLTMLAALPLDSLNELMIHPVMCGSQPSYHACSSDSVSRLLRSGGKEGSVTDCVHAQGNYCNNLCNKDIGSMNFKIA